MNSTASACTSLKDKVVNFASGIKASISDLCSRLFGLDVPATSAATNSSGATNQVSFHPTSIDYLKAMQASLAEGDLSGLFREASNKNDAVVFETALSQGKSPSLDTVSRNVIADHLKKELREFKMTAPLFETLGDLKEKWLSAPEGDKRQIAKEAVASYVESFSDTKKATVLLQIFAGCLNLVSDAPGSTFPRNSFDTCIVPNIMHPEHSNSMQGYTERQASGVQIFDMLMKGVSPLTPIRAPETKLSASN
ncbi:hypothetical protein VN23_02675 [Janthinobacterium sp. B9-8]|nr:hypothetical protein VN23_02675 [Janthinobacterium sp. B9-8]